MDNTHGITNDEDVIDSRDIIERMDHLSTLRDEFKENNEIPDEVDLEDGEYNEFNESPEGVELFNLETLAGDANCIDGWQEGATLIRDSYFEAYAEELVKDMGDLPKDLPWYIEHNIDWAGVASDIQDDYAQVQFDGVDYWVR